MTTLQQFTQKIHHFKCNHIESVILLIVCVCVCIKVVCILNRVPIFCITSLWNMRQGMWCVSSLPFSLFSQHWYWVECLLGIISTTKSFHLTIPQHHRQHGPTQTSLWQHVLQLLPYYCCKTYSK